MNNTVKEIMEVYRATANELADMRETAEDERIKYQQAIERLKTEVKNLDNLACNNEQSLLAANEQLRQERKKLKATSEQWEKARRHCDDLNAKITRARAYLIEKQPEKQTDYVRFFLGEVHKILADTKNNEN